MKKIIVFLLLIPMFYTCKKDAYTTDVCFKEDVLPIFVSNCTMSGCHNATEHEAGYDLSTYEGIMKGVTKNHPLNSEVYSSISGRNPSMPTRNYPKLSSEQVTIIKTWIRRGAPNSSDCYTCDTINYKFSSRIKPLVDTWCVGCHNASNAGGGYDLSTYSGIVTSINDNRFLQSINQEAGYSPMPKNVNKLSDCEIKAITKWINSGYPNN